MSDLQELRKEIDTIDKNSHERGSLLILKVI